MDSTEVREFFTWIHRYFRLHSELLENAVYQAMYEYHRKVLIHHFKKERKMKETDDQCGELIDVLADIYNRYSVERVNEYKPIVEELYDIWKDNFDKFKTLKILQD